jgi:SNF2 family DNA or RNA helicase
VERGLWRPDLELAVAKGSPTQRRAAIDYRADITVLGRENQGDILPTDRYRTLVLDELSGYKNRGSTRWKLARDIARRTSVKHVWGMTGTPAPNGYLDLWAQISMLDNGVRLGKGIGKYREAYFHVKRQLPNGHLIYEINPGADQKIKALIEDICLYMESDGRVHLPDFHVNPISIDLPSKVARVYNDLATRLVADTTAVFGGEVHSADTAAALSNRLSQIAAGFIYVDDADLNDYRYTPLHTEKIKALEEIVASAQGSGVLVFYRYRAEREMLTTAITEARTIDEPGVIEEWNAGRVPVLLAHPASASNGINLQHGGHTVVWTSLSWDLEHWEQGNKRLHRQGQQHPVVCHVLLGAGTVDELVLRRVHEKAEVQQDLLDYLRSPI